MAALVLAKLTGCSGAEAMATLRERRGNVVLQNAAFVEYLERLRAPG